MYHTILNAVFYCAVLHSFYIIMKTICSLLINLYYSIYERYNRVKQFVSRIDSALITVEQLTDIMYDNRDNTKDLTNSTRISKSTHIFQIFMSIITCIIGMFCYFNIVNRGSYKTICTANIAQPYRQPYAQPSAQPSAGQDVHENTDIARLIEELIQNTKHGDYQNYTESEKNLVENHKPAFNYQSKDNYFVNNIANILSMQNMQTYIPLLIKAYQSYHQGKISSDDIITMCGETVFKKYGKSQEKDQCRLVL